MNTAPEASPAVVPLAQWEQAAQAGDAGAQLALANHLLKTHRFGTAEHDRGRQLLLAAADGPRAREACWFLGAYYLQVTTWPDAHAQAAHWLERAAQAGVAPAIDRLATLHLQGIGIAFDPARALALQRHLADAGFQQAAWEAGYLLDRCGDGDAAATAFARACALGFPPAYYSLGLRLALAAVDRRDLALARALLLRAADAGFPDAASAADALAPAAVAGAQAGQWHRRLKENLVAARPILQSLQPADVPLAQASLHPLVVSLERHFADIGHAALRIDGAGRLQAAAGCSGSPRTEPAPLQWLAQQPRIGVSRGFASREECAHMMHKAAPKLRHPRDYLHADSVNDASEGEFFNGQGHPPGALFADAVVRSIERRVATIAGWDVTALEPHAVIRYQPGEEYLPHVDSFTAEQILVNRRRGDLGGQRVVTFLLCLHAAEEGGETFFHHPDLAVRGEVGMGLLHYNAIADGGLDAQSLHSGRPVRRGEKWMWRSTLREHPLYPTAADATRNDPLQP